MNPIHEEIENFLHPYELGHVPNRATWIMGAFIVVGITAGANLAGELQKIIGLGSLALGLFLLWNGLNRMERSELKPKPYWLGFTEVILAIPSLYPAAWLLAN